MKLSSTGPGHRQPSLPWLQLSSAIRIHYTIHLAFSSRSSMRSKAVLNHLSCPAHISLYNGIYIEPRATIFISYSQSWPPAWLAETTGCCLPSNQHFMACSPSLCWIQSEFLTGEGTSTSRLALLQTTPENLEKGRKRFWGPKFNLSVGHAERESPLERWSTQLSDFRKTVAVRSLWLLSALYCNYRLTKPVG